MNELVAVVLDAPHHWVRVTAEAIRAADCEVGVVSTPAIAERAGLDGLIDELAPVENPLDPDQVAEAAARLAASYRLSALLTASDPALAGTAIAADRLGLRGPPVSGLTRWRDKYAAREALRSAGLAVPRYALMDDPGDADRLANEVGMPSILKPVTGTGSHLVQVVHTADELATAYRAADRRLLDAAQLRHFYPPRPGDVHRSRTFLLEEMLTGPEFCLDVLVRDRSAELLPLIGKPLVDEKFFELGFVIPPVDLDPHRARRIGSAVDAVVTALDLDNVVAHVEVIDDEHRGPTVVEVNVRPGGACTATLYRLTTGISTFAEQVAIARGRPSPREGPSLPIQLAALQLYAPRPGRIREIRGLDAVTEHPDVISADPLARPGDLLSADHESPVVQCVVAGFADIEELAETYHALAGSVHVDVESVPLSGAAMADSSKEGIP